MRLQHESGSGVRSGIDANDAICIDCRTIHDIWTGHIRREAKSDAKTKVIFEDIRGIPR